ncbi:hypothetical protein I2H38_19125 [Microvirga sp. BT350]|uniref:Uncharacterized protein n=1 Tax=Microvirga alba TaxID=2791025 RepID=A0A931BTL2_9HYPH|nr:hypothetical protein [Microvirga alba]MBF9235479.1 hypothetical protein [Microvirga alba]
MSRIDSKLSSLSDYVELPSPDILDKAKRFHTFLEDLQRCDFKKYILPVRRYANGRAIVDDDVIVFGPADYLDLSRTDWRGVSSALWQGADGASLSNALTMALSPNGRGGRHAWKALSIISGMLSEAGPGRP